MREQTPNQDEDMLAFYMRQELARRNEVAALSARCTALEGAADSDRAVITAIRNAVWEASVAREFGEDRTLTAMVQKIIAQRDEARDNRRGEYELRTVAEARCEALEQEKDTLLECIAERDGIIAGLTDRCEALTAERDKSNKHEADAWLQVEEWRSRCQHLEQAVKGHAKAWREEAASLADWNSAGGALIDCADELEAALASLPTQEETPGTDENRVSFAAGYTAALDDALKGKTHD